MVSNLSLVLVTFLAVANRVDRPATWANNEVLEDQVRVGRVLIVGNTHTRDRIILRELPFYPGAVLHAKDLRTAEKNLQRLKLFKETACFSVHIEDSSSMFWDVVVLVTEKRERNGPGFSCLCYVEDLVEGTFLEEPLARAEGLRGRRPLFRAAFGIFESSLDSVGAARRFVARLQR
jgi:hypothetical protein